MSRQNTAAEEPINSILNKRITEMTWDEIRYLAGLSNERLTAADLHKKFQAISAENKKRREADSGH